MAGAVFVYCGLFLYENEENTIHNKLDELWRFLDEKSEKAIRGHVTIIQKLGLAANLGITKIFGDKVWTKQNLVSNCCLSFLTISSMVSICTIYFASRGLTLDYFLLHNVSQFSFAVSFLALLLSPLLKTYQQSKRLWLITATVSILVFLCQIVTDTFYFSKISPDVYPDMTMIDYLFINAPPLVFALIAIIQFPPIFRNVVETVFIGKKSNNKSKGIILALMVIGFIVYTMSSSLYKNTDSTGRVLYGFVAHSHFDYVICFLGFYGVAWLFLVVLLLTLAGLLSIHSTLWGAIKRPAYSIARHKVFNKHKQLVIVGAALLGYAIHLPSIVKEIIGAF